MHKMEQEMEEVFEMKVQEKLQKLKDIEADVSWREGQGSQIIGSSRERKGHRPWAPVGERKKGHGLQ